MFFVSLHSCFQRIVNILPFVIHLVVVFTDVILSLVMLNLGSINSWGEVLYRQFHKVVLGGTCQDEQHMIESSLPFPVDNIIA